ncbi:MAG: 16S rRNA (guanine(527)-N(7))-methyltransferase RsmG [Clostridiales bacterium]|jgi:16S rRNA (guanine527-N7)-methyltransferase|nr:16S rRNA (guanine(527)-N(7))-methyltransferase RsmG [Clostridiales bacterium]
MWNRLTTLCTEQNIQLPPEAPALFAQYYQLLLEGNEKCNLTRITDPEEALIKHFFDSLQLLAWYPDPPGPILDVGSGAGFPGIPLNIARPEIPVVMLDSSKKRVDFLNGSGAALGLTELTAIHGRAEDIARLPNHRDKYRLVVSRAVARLPVLLELCLPFVAPEGMFISYKGPEAGQEVKDSAQALQELNSRLETTKSYTLPDNMGTRSLLFFRKEDVTPARYPRKAGTPEKRPL